MSSGDYISREEAKNAAALIALTSSKREMTCGEVKRIMENIPPAEVRPVVRGEWLDGYNEDNDVRVSRCSKCGHEKPRFCKPPFCEQCGADMRPAPEPPAEKPAAICQTCGNFETCPWQNDPNIAEYLQTTESRVVACSEFKAKKG